MFFLRENIKNFTEGFLTLKCSKYFFNLENLQNRKIIFSFDWKMKLVI